MFHAIRDYFARPDEVAPRKGRGRRVGGLFLFEFVVVVLGVLAAQLLQDWFAERSDARRAREAVASFRQEMNAFAQTAVFRVRTHQCETDRLRKLIRIARNGGTATRAERATPMMPMPALTRWEEGTRRAVARHVDPGLLQTYDGAQVLATMISERQRQLENQWADFRLLDPELGADLAETRADLLLAGARAMGLLSAIDMNAEIVIRYAPSSFKVDEAGMAEMAKLDRPCAPAAAKPVPRSLNYGVRA